MLSGASASSTNQPSKIDRLMETCLVNEPNGNSIILISDKDSHSLVVMRDSKCLLSIALSATQAEELRPNNTLTTDQKTEIERKWVIKAESMPPLESLSEYPYTTIHQGYIALDSATKSEARVRSRDGVVTFTIKIGTGEIRGEREIEFTPSQNGAELFKHCEANGKNRVVDKVRYEIPIHDSGEPIELDIYTQDLAGLVIAEREYSARDSSLIAAPLKLFDVDAIEVTEEKAFKNQSLAVNGAPKVSWI